MKTATWKFKSDNWIQRITAIWDLLITGELSGDKIVVTSKKVKRGGEK